MSIFAKHVSRSVTGSVCALLLAGCSHSPTRSVATDSYCQTGLSPIVARYRPAKTPKYFFKPVGDGSELAFVGYDAATNTDQNYLYEPATGKLTPVPGEFDPIGLLGSPLITVPQDDGKGRTSMYFYDLRELRRDGVRTRPLLKTDTTLRGRYQTLGTLERYPDGRVKFRIITDGSEGGDFRDFELNPAMQPAGLRPLGATRPLCTNLRDHESGQLKQKLPMLSKDGRFVSLFDLVEQRMRIYRIDSRTGACQESDSPSSNRGDIGKLDFSPDSRRVAFHFSDRSLDLGPLTFGTTEVHWQLRSTVYDLKEQRYQLLPFFGKNANTFYPAFLPNGRVMVLQSTGDLSEFVEVDLSRVPAVSRRKVDMIAGLEDRDFLPFQRLSDRFVEKCYTEPTMSLRANRLLNLLSLSRDQCLALARDTAASSEGERQALQKACQTLASDS